MTKTISGTYTGTGAYLLTSAAADSPVTITSSADITQGGLYVLEANTNWTIFNAGTITRTANTDGGVQIGNGSEPVASLAFTNQTGGTITGMVAGLLVYSPASATNIVNQSGATITANGAVSDGIGLVDGGTVTNSGVIFGTTVGVLLDGVGTVINAGTISATNQHAVAFYAYSTSNLVIADPGAAFNGGIGGGTGVLELAAGAGAGSLSGFGSGITNFSSLTFDGGAHWTISGDDSPDGLGTLGINGFATTDTIDLTGFVAVSRTFTSNTLVLTDAGDAHATLNIQGSFSTDQFHVTPQGETGTEITLLCFLSGTSIATPTGEVPVERLAIGDMVLTQRGAARPITWIGHGKALAPRGQRSAATPVIVRRGALADNVPHRDLHVTKGHSLFLDEALIPAEFLVNHRSVVWDDRAQEVEVYHIELATHDVLLANGAPAESYRDDGNRWLFRNANTLWQQSAQRPCAAVLTGGPVVDAVWRRLLDRSGPRPDLATTDDPDLHLLVDGARVDGRSMGNGVHEFHLPKPPGKVRIVSRAGSPDMLGLARDPRLLGVALRQVTLWHGRHARVMAADDALLCDGFHAFEVEYRFRWTNGDAALPTALFDRVDGACELTLHLGCTTQYPLSDDRVRDAA
jgi:hypothetical protein